MVPVDAAVNGIIAFSYYTYEPKSEMAGITVHWQWVNKQNLDSDYLKEIITNR